MLNQMWRRVLNAFFLTKSLFQIWRGGQNGNAADFARQQMRHRHVVWRHRMRNFILRADPSLNWPVAPTLEKTHTSGLDASLPSEQKKG